VGLDEERVYRNNVDKRDEFHLRILDAADRIQEGEDQLRPKTREVFLPTFNFLLYFVGRHLITFFVNNQLESTILFLVFVYSNSLHVSSNKVLIIRAVNCINTIADICHSGNR